MQKSVTVPIDDPSQVGEARRVGTELARALGFNDTQLGRASLVATEAAGNIIKHAGSGEVIFRDISDRKTSGLEMLALDRGPGMADVSRCLEDGYSTAGSPGTGLGAVRRLSMQFDLYSVYGKGTALLSQLWPTPDYRPAGGNLNIGVVCLAMERGVPCGDAWAAHVRQHRVLILLADGLGHGPLAARAADEAVRVFSEDSTRGPAEILQAAHGPLRATRGAGVSVAEIDCGERRVRYAGIGNIAGGILDGVASRSFVTLNGTLGHEWQQLREFTYVWPAGGLLVMHTDGLGSRWTLRDYPGLIGRHPSIVAGVLYRDFKRGNDDVTVVVMRDGAD